MTITKIENQRHDPQRYSVFIDGNFAFGLDGVDLLYYKLKEGIELSKEEYERIINDTLFTKARDAAVRYLAYQPRSRKEVIGKLTEKEFGGDVIERVIEQMEKYGYIDDEKFCEMFISDKSRLNGFGSVRIAYELQQRGVDAALIDKCIAENGLDDFDGACKALRKKYRNGFPDCPDGSVQFLKEKKKAFDYLVRRGYPYETAGDAISRFIRGLD